MKVLRFIVIPLLVFLLACGRLIMRNSNSDGHDSNEKDSIVAYSDKRYLRDIKKSDNIDLSEFAQAILKIFISTTSEAGFKVGSDDEVIISVYVSGDTCHLGFSAFDFDDSGFNYSPSGYRGMATFNGHKIYVFGDNCSSIYSIKSKFLGYYESPGDEKSIEFDPIHWSICVDAKRGILLMDETEQYWDKNLYPGILPKLAKLTEKYLAET